MASTSCEAILFADGRNKQRRTLRRLGIKSIRYMKLGVVALGQYIDHAKVIIEEVSKNGGIASIELPFGVPSELLYDFVLKRMRSEFVDWEAEPVTEIVAQYLCSIGQVETILDKTEPKLAIASHALGYMGPLVWVSLLRGIDVIVPYGENEQLRFWRPKNRFDIFDFQDCPNAEEFNEIKNTRHTWFKCQGQKVLMRRLRGEANDLGSKKAYLERTEQIDRNSICDRWSWDAEKKL